MARRPQHGVRYGTRLANHVREENDQPQHVKQRRQHKAIIALLDEVDRLTSLLEGLCTGGETTKGDVK